MEYLGIFAYNLSCVTVVFFTGFWFGTRMGNVRLCEAERAAERAYRSMKKYRQHQSSCDDNEYGERREKVLNTPLP